MNDASIGSTDSQSWQTLYTDSQRAVVESNGPILFGNRNDSNRFVIESNVFEQRIGTNVLWQVRQVAVERGKETEILRMWSRQAISALSGQTVGDVITIT